MSDFWLLKLGVALEVLLLKTFFILPAGDLDRPEVWLCGGCRPVWLAESLRIGSADEEWSEETDTEYVADLERASSGIVSVASVSRLCTSGACFAWIRGDEVVKCPIWDGCVEGTVGRAGDLLGVLSS